MGGLTIQGAEAFQSSFGPTFQQFLTDSYNETYGASTVSLDVWHSNSCC